jgi:acyl-CoA synthetase (AMP-forming)/AMP-acid ligase II/aryl carrier-like protein
MRIFNEYGPTEATVGCIVKELSLETKKVLIGQPIANTQVYILDKNQQLLPQGVFGEIWIGGKGVGKGYINNAKLTATRFIENPFAEGIIYKTGDVGRWTETGEVDYLGRIDEQVKIKGYRIELGEIEAQIQKINGVKDVKVIDIQDGHEEKQLAAYYTGSITSSEIKHTLAGQLPNYMVPAFVVQLDAIPLTANGKVDRRALPKPKKESSRSTYQTPESHVEQLLAEIWKKVLHVERVSKTDDFFDLGGDSIKAIQLSSRLRNKGYSIKIKDVFEKSEN